MGKRNNRTDRRGANVTASRSYIKTVQYYKTPSRTRLHVRPSPRTLSTPAADAVLSRVHRRPPQPAADNRFYHPLGRQRPVVTYSGTPSRPKRLHDAPRPVKSHVQKWSTSNRRHSAAVQRATYVANRFGPMIDRQTKAILAFADAKQLPLCSQRKARRQVLHARGIAGGRVRKPTFKSNSKVSCHGA